MNKTFRKRVELVWKEFSKKEERFRKLTRKKNPTNEEIDELVDSAAAIFRKAIPELEFEIGPRSRKCEITFWVQASRLIIFMLDYLVSKAPEDLRKNWIFTIGREPSPGRIVGIAASHASITAKDVKVRLEKVDDMFDVTFYNKQMLPLWERYEPFALGLMNQLLEETVGELTSLAYISNMKISAKDMRKNVFPLSELPIELLRLGRRPIQSYKELIEPKYYEGKSKKAIDAELREDIVAGITKYPHLLKDYDNKNDENILWLEFNGADAGFIFFSMKEVQENGNIEKRSALSDEFQAYLKETCGGSITIIGDAGGYRYEYIDFLAWDLPEVLEAVQNFFKDGRADVAGVKPFKNDDMELILYSKE